MSSTFNCLDQLNNYSNFLSANPFIGSPRPQPLLWTGTNCSGNQIFPITEAFLSGSPGYVNLYSDEFNSLYVPSGWTVTLSDGADLIKVYPEPGTEATLPVLVSDFSAIYYPSSSLSLKNAVRNVTFDVKPDMNSWKLQMCNSEISTVVGAHHLTSWQTGSVECDTFMTGFCSACKALKGAPAVDYTQVGCAPNSTQPAPLPEACRYCTCLVEENCLKETFCTPGSTDPSCQTNEAFAQFIPVACFGKQCSLDGYRWRRMMDSKCSITLCQQIIRLVGNEIVAKGSSTLWCGNQSIPLTTVTPTVTVSSPPSDGLQLSTWVWVVIGVAVFFMAVVIPLSVVLWLRSYRKAGKTLPLHEITPARPPTDSAAVPEFQVYSSET